MLIFVASGGIPTRGQGARHVGIFFNTSFDFCFSELILEMRLGPHGKVDKIFGFLWGATPTKRIKIF